MLELSRQFEARAALDAVARRLNRAPEALFEKSPRIYFSVAAAIALTGLLFLLSFPAITAYVFALLGGRLLEGQLLLLSWDVASGALIAAGGVWITLYLIRVQPELPAGCKLGSSEGSELRALVSQLRDRYRAPPIASFTITDRWSVDVRRVPVGGIPLVFRNHLEIGLPVLLSMSPGYCEGMLAGKIGQLSGLHDKWSGWLSTQCEVWSLHRSVWSKDRRFPGFVLAAFSAGFVPLLAWFSRCAVRRHRLEFDRYAHDVLSAQDLSDMIAVSVVVDRFLEERYWPMIYKAAERMAEPTVLPYANLEQMLKLKVDEQDVQRWLRQAMSVPDDGISETPVLRARLEEIGQDRIAWPGIASETACSRYLGVSARAIVTDHDRAWVERNRGAWRKCFDQSQDDRNRLRALSMKFKCEPLRGRDAMTYAALTKKFCDRDEAVDAYKRILDINPDDARSQFGVGKYLVGVGYANGVKALENAMELDKQYVDPACRLISEFTAHHRKQARGRDGPNGWAKAG